MKPPPLQEYDLDFDYGTFDSAGFTANTLSSWQSLAAVIDHTLVKPVATRKRVETLCAEAARYRFACVLVNPMWTSIAVSALAGTGIPTGAVIGSPLGGSLVSTLRQEITALIRLGVREFDMVLPIGQLKSGNHTAVQRTIRAVVGVAHHHGALLKVTLETALLTMEEKLRASEIAIQAGADFIKTSTGSAAGGAIRRYSTDARRSRSPMRNQSFRRHPHPGPIAYAARSRRQPHWLLSVSGNSARAWRGIEQERDAEAIGLDL
jgi:deoxyribose-phosphate aldolase